MRRRNKIETQILELSIKKGTEAPGGKRKPKAGTGIEQQIDQEYNQAQRIFIYSLLGAGIIKPYIIDWVITVSRIFQAPLIWAKIKRHSTVILLGELMGFIVYCI